MSQILKRKRRASNCSADYANEEKKLKIEDTDVPINETENVEEEIIWSSEISLADFREDDADLSRICSSDPPGPAHFIHDSCTEVSKPAKPLDDHLNDVDDLRSSQSEPDDSSEIDVILYPRTNPDLSSCDESVIHSEEVISSPVAGSLIGTDFEDNLLDSKDDVDVDNGPATAGKAVTFMGLVTPGSSICNFKSPNYECSKWTHLQKANQNNELYSPDCPVPQLPWAKREEFWQVMCSKDELSLETRDADLFDYQPHLRPRMRVKLLDWISEVADYFKLHRETYHLCVDYIDRYLTSVFNIPVKQLQLIGITCLFLAFKMEELEIPKINKFAEVTDGACTEAEICAMEVAILKHLNWSLSPITINNWLEMLLQFIYQKLEKKNENILTPHFSSTLFKRLCQLLNLITLDITSLRFSYGVLVASAIYILVDRHLAISSSGLKEEILEPCVQWMSVYWEVLRESNAAEMTGVNSLLTDKSEIYFSDQHPELHTHNISIELYDNAQKRFEILAQREIPSTSCRILTPPPSSSKSFTCHSDGD